MGWLDVAGSEEGLGGGEGTPGSASALEASFGKCGGGHIQRWGGALDRSGGQLTAKPPMAGVASILPARLGLGC